MSGNNALTPGVLARGGRTFPIGKTADLIHVNPEPEDSWRVLREMETEGHEDMNRAVVTRS